MSITIDVAPDVEQRIQIEAAQQGQDATVLLRRVMEERFGAPRPQAKPDFFSPESIAAWEAMIDSFSEGDEREQRETLEWLRTHLDEDRPGQRRVFGPGYNPPLPADQEQAGK